MRDVISERDKLKLVSGIRQAATNQLDWRWFLDDLHHISGGAKVHLSSLDSISHLPIDMMQIGFDPAYIDSLRREYGMLNKWAHRSRLTPIGLLQSTRQLVPDAEMKATEFYNDWVKPQEDSLGGAAMNLAQDNHRRFVIGGIIRSVDREVLEPRFLGILNFLLPHFREALEINKMLGSQSLREHINREGMHPEIAACFLLTSKFKLIYANDQGQELISKGDVVRCNFHSTLRLSDKNAHQKLASSLFGFSNSDTRFAPPFFIRSTSARPTYVCRAVKLDSRNNLPAPYPFDRNASDLTLLLMTRILTGHNLQDHPSEF